MARTRIAPSPTGQDLHIGNLYTALINYSYARKNRGRFIVRIEDTDRTRYVPGAENRILDTLRDYGLEPDEDPLKGGPFAPYRQSERLDLYQRYAQTLVDKGAAYYCFCTPARLQELRERAVKEKRQPKYDRHCLNLSPEEVANNLKDNRPRVIRLRIPDGETGFRDVIRGDINIRNEVLDDQILIKSDGYPTYHMAVVVDDKLMEITHIIRAEEWISSTPKHVILYRALDWELPLFAHVPLLRNPDKTKLSKRKNPVWASWYLKEGYLPDAVLNYLALMGWSHPEEKEIFGLKEYIDVIRLEDIQPVGPIFDLKKLEWLSGEHIRLMPPAGLKERIVKYLGKHQDIHLKINEIEQTIPLVQTRMKKLSEYWPLVSFIFKQPDRIEFPLNLLKQCQKDLFNIYEQIEWTAGQVHEKTEQLAVQADIKPIKLFMDIRYALSNQKVTAPLFESMEIIGKEKTLERLRSALKVV